MARLMEKYHKEILPQLKSELGRDNLMSIPRVVKVVVSMGVGEAIQDRKRIDTVASELALIAGQKPVVCNSKKSVSNFKLRKGYPIGIKVTMRGKRCYEFLDRLISVVIPRIRDFRGLNPNSFDGHGNYSVGLTDQSVFPEIDIDKITHSQGMDVTIVTTARDDTEARRLLSGMGMPFRN